jgi:hypothetical protein
MDIFVHALICSQKAFFANSGEASSSNVDVLPLHDSATQSHVATPKLEIGVAGGRMRLVIFEAVQVLIPLAAHLAAIWLFFLHAQGTWIWCRCFGVDD